MDQEQRPTIYKEMIQYILNSTNYTLKNIAEFTNCSVTTIYTIYKEAILPKEFKSELELIKLYHLVIDISITKKTSFWRKQSVCQ